MRVVPEKADGRADHGSAKDRQLTHQGHALQFKVVGKNHVAAYIRENSERARRDDGAADGEAVQPVGQVDGVGGAHQDEDHEDHKGQECEETQVRNGAGPVPLHVGAQGFEKWHGQGCGEHLELGETSQRHSHRGCGQALPKELGLRRKTETAAPDHLDVVVGKADSSESQSGEDDDPDKGIGRVGPQHRRQQNGDDDEHSAHGGRAGFLQVRLRPVFANVLADLELAQLLNHVRADE